MADRILEIIPYFPWRVFCDLPSNNTHNMLLELEVYFPVFESYPKFICQTHGKGLSPGQSQTRASCSYKSSCMHTHKCKQKHTTYFNTSLQPALFNSLYNFNSVFSILNYVLFSLMFVSYIVLWSILTGKLKEGKNHLIQ